MTLLVVYLGHGGLFSSDLAVLFFSQLGPTTMGSIFSDNLSLQQGSPTPKVRYHPLIVGPEIIVISGFRNKIEARKSADLVISEPRNNSSSILSEQGVFGFWELPRTKYHISTMPTLHLV